MADDRLPETFRDGDGKWMSRSVLVEEVADDEDDIDDVERVLDELLDETRIQRQDLDGVEYVQLAPGSLAFYLKHRTQKGVSETIGTMKRYIGENDG